MPRGETKTYSEASKEFRAFLAKRSPDARKAYLETLESDVRRMGAKPAKVKRAKKVAAPKQARATAPAPAKKSHKKKAQSKPATQPTGENSDS